MLTRELCAKVLEAAAETVILPFSALTKSGVEEIRKQIEAVL